MTLKSGPLAGVKVIEMEGLAPGPYAAMLLADLGAEVLRIERPGAAPIGVTGEHQLLNRNRSCISLDLKSEEGRAVLMELISRADALIEGFRPGVMERLGFGPDACLALNARLVFGRITGWGQDGPLAMSAGHDINYIALTGAQHSIGTPEQPVIPLNVVGDFAGGGMFLAFGIVCALLEARTSGKGQVVDAAMVDGAASLMTYIFANRAAGSWSDTRGQNVLDGGCPWYNNYKTRDGKFVSIAAAEPKFYAEFLRLTGLAEEDLPDQMDFGNWPALRARFAALFATRTQAEWCELLEGTDACFAPVLTLPEALEHPHNRERGTFVTVAGHPQPAPGPRFSRTPAAMPTPPEPADADTAGTLARWGYGADQVAALQARSVLR